MEDRLEIWKYELDIEDVQRVRMPDGANLLHVDVQYNRLCVWAMVNPVAGLTSRKFRIFGTGHKIDPGLATGLTYLGTAMMNGGALVWHVFVEGSR